MSTFSFHPDLDWGAAAAAFAAEGRVRLQPFLAPGQAEDLHQLLRQRTDWLQVILSGDRIIELDRPTRAAFDRDRKERLDAAVFGAARDGFQFRYESIRVPDSAAERAASSDPLAALAAFLSSPQAMERLREVTGLASISFADAQATAYSPGDFLTSHTDEVAGKNRHAAYVLGLTPGWRIDWGGLLLIARRSGGMEALVPAFNSLDLFAVPTPHSVSLVSPAAPRRRYSITGWLRSAGARG